MKIHKVIDKNKVRMINILEIIVLILYLCLLKVPFIFCRDITYDYFYERLTNNVFSTVLYWAFEVLYLLIVLWMILKIKAHKTNK